MWASLKVGARLALFLLGACEAEAGGAPAALEPRASDAPPSIASHPTDQAPTDPAGPARQETEAARRHEPYLELVLPRPTYFLGEPVTLVASVVNGSSEPVELYPYLHPEFSFLEVRVTGPDGKPRTYEPPVRREGGRGVEPVVLEPGERYSDLVPIFFASDGWFLPEVGEYAVEASFAPDKEVLTAEPVRFEVRAPERSSDLEAARFAMESATARAFYDPGGASAAEEVQRLESLVEKYPESHLAGYAHLALGRHWNREVLDHGTKTVRPADPKRALPRFERALDKLGDPLAWTQASLELARCYTQLGDERAAGLELDKALRRFPELARTRVFDQSLAELRQLRKD